MCSPEDPATGKANLKLVIMNGPDDGTEVDLEREQFLISASPDAYVRIQYDPQVPSAGIVARITSDCVVFESVGAGNNVHKRFGDLHTIGQTLVAVYKEEPTKPSSAETASGKGEGT